MILTLLPTLSTLEMSSLCWGVVFWIVYEVLGFYQLWLLPVRALLFVNSLTGPPTSTSGNYSVLGLLVGWSLLKLTQYRSDGGVRPGCTIRLLPSIALVASVQQKLKTKMNGSNHKKLKLNLYVTAALVYTFCKNITAVLRTVDFSLVTTINIIMVSICLIEYLVSYQTLELSLIHI